MVEKVTSNIEWKICKCEIYIVYVYNVKKKLDPHPNALGAPYSRWDDGLSWMNFFNPWHSSNTGTKNYDLPWLVWIRAAGGRDKIFTG